MKDFSEQDWEIGVNQLRFIFYNPNDVQHGLRDPCTDLIKIGKNILTARNNNKKEYELCVHLIQALEQKFISQTLNLPVSKLETNKQKFCKFLFVALSELIKKYGPQREYTIDNNNDLTLIKAADNLFGRLLFIRESFGLWHVNIIRKQIRCIHGYIQKYTIKQENKQKNVKQPTISLTHNNQPIEDQSTIYLSGLSGTYLHIASDVPISYIIYHNKKICSVSPHQGTLHQKLSITIEPAQDTDIILVAGNPKDFIDIYQGKKQGYKVLIHIKI